MNVLATCFITTCEGLVVLSIYETWTRDTNTIRFGHGDTVNL